MKLWCGVYEDAIIFSVEIGRDADVKELQKAIVNTKKDVDVGFKLDPAKLSLRLAKKDDQWMQVDENTTALLKRVVDPGYKEMLSSLKLSAYFAPNASLGYGVIHVLVELPPPNLLGKRTREAVWLGDELDGIQTRKQRVGYW